MWLVPEFTGQIRRRPRCRKRKGTNEFKTMSYMSVVESVYNSVDAEEPMSRMLMADDAFSFALSCRVFYSFTARNMWIQIGYYHIWVLNDGILWCIYPRIPDNGFRQVYRQIVSWRASLSVDIIVNAYFYTQHSLKPACTARIFKSVGILRTNLAS